MIKPSRCVLRSLGGSKELESHSDKPKARDPLQILLKLILLPLLRPRLGIEYLQLLIVILCEICSTKGC